MVDAVALFLAMATQWIWVGAGMAGAFRAGLKYEVIKPVAKLIKVKPTPDVFADLRIMEAEAIDVWSARR